MVSIETKQHSWQMFDRIASTYDVLNRVLSLGIDRTWRDKLIEFLPHDRELHVLDVACGTGDLTLAMAEQKDNLTTLIGADLSKEMLSVAEDKLRRNLQKAEFVHASADELPFPDDSFDVISVAFGIRNFPDVKQALREFRRVLRENGKLLVLELTVPTNNLVGLPYLFYFRHVLPRIGGLISGDQAAYKYLNQSVEHFPQHGDFLELLHLEGFQNTSFHPLTMGFATLYQGSL